MRVNCSFNNFKITFLKKRQTKSFIFRLNEGGKKEKISKNSASTSRRHRLTNPIAVDFPSIETWTDLEHASFYKSL